MASFTTSDGADIHYAADADDGRPALLLSNSLGTDLGMWDPQLAAARARFRVVRYDSRGHGRSAAPAGAYAIDRLGRDALELLDALAIERAAFCGVSKGGMVGMWLAANAGHRLVRAALCNTAAHLPPADLWDGRIAAATTQGMAALADGVVERWFTAPFRAREPATVARIKAMILATPPAGYAGCCAAVRDMDQRGDLPRIAVPTLVVAGDTDPATPPAMGEAVAAAIPGARFEVLADCAHLANIEQPAAFDAAVFGFLAA